MRNLIVALAVACAVVVGGFANALADLSLAPTEFEVDSYVRDSISAQWDGFRNDGALLPMNGATRRWKDLAGDNDLILTASGGWRSDGSLAVDGCSATGGVCSTYKTIEAVFLTKGGGSSQVVFMGGERYHALVRVPSKSFVSFTINGTMKGAESAGTSGELEFVAGVYNEANTATTAAYANGVASDAGSQMVALHYDTDKSIVGLGAVVKTDPAWRGRLYALRLHDRVLTPEEIAVNAALDRVRFAQASVADAFAGISSPALVLSGSLGTATPSYGTYVFGEPTEKTCTVDFETQTYDDGVDAVAVRDGVRAVFGGYTLKRADGTLLASDATARTFTRTVDGPVLARWNFTFQYRHDFTAAANGTVTFGSQTGVTEAGGWCAERNDVEVTAVPATGYSFAGWSGDTEGLDASSSTLTFQPDRPRALVAHFKVKYDWSALSYVRNGLVAQYDGIENAGFGAHDAAATAWCDLSGQSYAAVRNGDAALPTWKATAAAWEDSAATSFYIPGSAALEPLGSGEFTVEYSATGSIPSNNIGLFSFWPLTSANAYASLMSMRGWSGTLYVGSYGGSAVQFSSLSNSKMKNKRFNVSIVRKPQENLFTVYYDGVKFGDYTVAEAAYRLDAGMIGYANSTALTSGFIGDVHAVRIYNRALTPSEIEQNNLADRARFYGEDGGDSRIDDWGDIIYRVQVASEAGVCAVTANGVTLADGASTWVKSGDTLTLVANELDGANRGFFQWEGLPIDVYPFNKTVSFVVTKPYLTISARMADIRHVTTEGDDATGTGTRAKPFASVQAALRSFSEDFGEIRVKGGLYVGCLTNSAKAKLVKNLSVRGSYNDDWVQDLRNARTVLKSLNASSDVITLAGVQTNRFDGLDITGGAKGITAVNQSYNATALSALGPYIHHFVTRCAITNNTSTGLHHYGTRSGCDDCGFAVASSLIAFNGDRGVTVDNYGSSTAHCYYYNCTVVRNQSDGIYAFAHFKNYMDNSIFAFNGVGTGGGFDLKTGYETCKILLDNLCAYGGASGVQGGYSASYEPKETYLNADPMFTDGQSFELSAKSPCNKRGIDLAGNGIVPVETDLYGTPWNGEYDLGCVKSEHPFVPPKARHPEVWVSSDGNDDNEGDAPERALATLGEAGRRLATGGTLHLGAGTFADGIELSGNGVRIVGEGRDKTCIRMKSGTAIMILGHDALVRDLTVEGAAVGVKLGLIDGWAPTNVVVRDCTFRSCSGHGWYMQQDGLNPGVFTNFVSRCIFTNCATAVEMKGTETGKNRHGDMLIDTCLMVGGARGYKTDCQRADAPVQRNNVHRLVNCTIFGNSDYGVNFGVWEDGFCDNCIIADNGNYNVYMGDWGSLTFRNSFVGGTVKSYNYGGSAHTTISAPGSETDFTDSSYLKLRRQGNRSLRPTRSSPVKGFGKRALAADFVKTDLDGKPAPIRSWDAGCYFANHKGLVLFLR